MGLTGCASILSTHRWPLSINSTPAGATITITDKLKRHVYSGTTPAKITVDSYAGFFKKNYYEVTLSKPGYADIIVPVTFKVNGLYWGNIFIGGVIGMLIVDPATGAMYAIRNPVINKTLQPNSSNVFVQPTLQILTTDDVPDSLVNKMVRVK